MKRVGKFQNGGGLQIFLVLMYLKVFMYVVYEHIKLILFNFESTKVKICNQLNTRANVFHDNIFIIHNIIKKLTIIE